MLSRVVFPKDRLALRLAHEAPGRIGGDESHDGGHDDGGHEDDGHDGGHGGGGGCTGGGRETITDFEPGLDTIDFRGIGTVTGLADGPEAYSAWVEQDGEDTILRVDTDGNVSGEHPEDMTIVLQNVSAASITVDDFFF